MMMVYQSEVGLPSLYQVGQVVAVLQPILSAEGLLARPGDLGCVVIAEATRIQKGDNQMIGCGFGMTLAVLIMVVIHVLNLI